MSSFIPLAFSPPWKQGLATARSSLAAPLLPLARPCGSLSPAPEQQTRTHWPRSPLLCIGEAVSAPGAAPHGCAAVRALLWHVRAAHVGPLCKARGAKGRGGA